MADGWIAVSRGLLDVRHDLHPQSRGESACSMAAWIDLVGYARWKDSGDLKRGQLRASVRFLAGRWGWSKSRVARFLDELRDAGRIERGTQAGREPGTITICNYDTYQEPWDTGGTQVNRERDANEDKEEQEQQQEQETTSSGNSHTADLWEVWIGEVWEGDTQRQLTDKRRKKLKLTWEEHLQDKDDPTGFFRQMVRAMLNDSWWGPKKNTHVPEKAFRNAERREDWALKAAANGKRQSRYKSREQIEAIYGDDD